MAEPYVADGYVDCDYADPCEDVVDAAGPTSIANVVRPAYRLLLSEVLPLRSSRVLGDYAEDTVLPVIFGDLTAAPFPLIRLDDTRYFVADHPAEVTKVFVDAQRVYGWAASLESDDVRTWTIVTFTAPVAQSSKVSACGRGKRHDLTGELIENPGDAMALVSELAGRDDDWSGLRAECSGLRGAGRLFERKAVRLHLDDVAQPFGIIWWHRGARRYPSATTGIVFDLAAQEVDNLRVTANLTDTADVLRIGYDWSDASERALHFIELTASPQRYGGLVKEVVYKHLRTPVDAEAVGRPVLQRLAGERYGVSFLSDNTSLRAGMDVRLVDHPDWMINDDDPLVTLLRVELDRDNGSADVVGETLVGQADVTVTAHSIALPDEIAAGIEVALHDGIATFTIEDDEQHALPGARVSLDGGAPKTTDAQGKVSFTASAGPHELAVEAAGFMPFTLQVTL